MRFLRSAFEGPESHQCRTMGLKSGPPEEMYAWTCWSSDAFPWGAWPRDAAVDTRK